MNEYLLEITAGLPDTEEADYQRRNRKRKANRKKRRRKEAFMGYEPVEV